MESLMRLLPPLRTRKNPTIAAIVGFVFGGIGIAIYCASLPDVFVCVLWVFLIVATLPADVFSLGLPYIVAVLGTAVYGYFRVSASNARLEGR